VAVVAAGDADAAGLLAAGVNAATAEAKAWSLEVVTLASGLAAGTSSGGWVRM